MPRRRRASPTPRPRSPLPTAVGSTPRRCSGIGRGRRRSRAPAVPTSPRSPPPRSARSAAGHARCPADGRTGRLLEERDELLADGRRQTCPGLDRSRGPVAAFDPAHEGLRDAGGVTDLPPGSGPSGVERPVARHRVGSRPLRPIAVPRPCACPDRHWLPGPYEPRLTIGLTAPIAARMTSCIAAPLFGGPLHPALLRAPIAYGRPFVVQIWKAEFCRTQTARGIAAVERGHATSDQSGA